MYHADLYPQEKGTIQLNGHEVFRFQEVLVQLESWIVLELAGFFSYGDGADSEHISEYGLE
jgi:hypothetical protein